MGVGAAAITRSNHFNSHGLRYDAGLSNQLEFRLFVKFGFVDGFVQFRFLVGVIGNI